jgi:hypothetical protein
MLYVASVNGISIFVIIIAICTEHPLDSIAIGIVEARSFLFSYGDAGSGADSDKKKKSGAGKISLLCRCCY